MTASARAVLWAGVSSRPQAGDDKDSLANQLTEGRALAERHGWQVVAELQVPGATRSYVDLADAIDGLDDDLGKLRLDVPNAYRELAHLIGARQVDVVVCRGRDRLGRTDSLIAGIEERLRRIGAAVYSAAMPPTGAVSGDLYASAIERARARDEIETLRKRQQAGMDSRARRGLPLAWRVPFGYREVFQQVGARMIRKAEPEPAEAAAYLAAVRDILTRRGTNEDILDLWRVQFPRAKGWGHSALYDIFRNPFQAGVILRRRKRNPGEGAALKVVAPDGASIFDDPHWPDAERILAARAERGVTVNRDRAGGHKLAIVSPGVHAPIIDLATWVALQREMDDRSARRRPGSSSALWSGLARCGRCGALMHYAKKTHGGYYRCANRDSRAADPCANPPIKGEVITEGVAAYLRGLYEALADEVRALEAGEPSPTAPSIVAGLEAQANDLRLRRSRLLTLYETGRIDLDGFDGRAVEIDQALLGLMERIDQERRVVESEAGRTVRLAALEDLLPVIGERLAAVEPAAGNRWLREMVESVLIDGREVREVRLRW